MESPPRKVFEVLSSLRRKVRKVFVADGLFTLGLGLCAALFLSFLLDYSLVLPVAVRLVFLMAGVGALAWFAIKKVGSRLQKPITDVDLANLIERAHPRLCQSFITAVELSRPGNEAAAHVSRPMLESVMRSAEEMAGQIDLGQVFNLRWFHGKARILMGSWGLLLLALLAYPALSTIWFRRNVLLGVDAWPRQTVLRLVSPPLPAVVAMGDNLEVAVQVARGTPKMLSIHSWERDRSGRVEILTETRAGLFRKLYENVSRSFSFSVKGGDAEIGPYDVEVKLRPRIDMQSIKVWCNYPEYTRLPDTPLDAPARHGNLKVPAKTKVRFQMASNIPIRKAYFIFKTAASEKPPSPAESSGKSGGPAEAGKEAAAPAADTWPDPGAVDLAVEGGSTFSGEFDVLESGQYYFQLESADSFRSLRPDRFRVEAISDRKPVVKVMAPERLEEEVSTVAVVKIRVAANDDYGVRSGSVEGVYLAGAGAKGIPHSIPLPGLESPVPEEGVEAAAGPSGQSVEDEVTVKIAELKTPDGQPPPPGTSFQYMALATDLGGNVGESQVHYFPILAKDDLLRILNDQLIGVRDQLKEALRKQVSARKDLEELGSQIAPSGKLTAQEAPKLYRHQQDQQRVTQALQREGLELDRILARSATNDVGDKKWRDWLGNVREDLQAVFRGLSPEIETSLADLQKELVRAPVDVTRLASVEEAQKGVERAVNDLVLRLTEFGDMNALIQMLKEVKRRQAELREETNSRVKGRSLEESQK